MNFNKVPMRVALSILAIALASSLAACGQSKADKVADDVAAMRALAEKQEAERQAAKEQEKKDFAELKAQAASDAKAMAKK